MRTLLQLAMFVSVVMVASAQNDCGHTSFSGTRGIVTSPNLPLHHPQDLSCTYSIDVGLNNSVLLEFIDIDLDESLHSNCTHERLTITCNETDDENRDFEQRYGGTELTRTSLWFSNCPVFLINFFTDSSIDCGGFSIEYTVFENTNAQDFTNDLDCGETVFTNSYGVIHLPANTKDYSANVTCTYTIVATDTSSFTLGVFSLQIPQLLDSFEDCNRDNIRIGCLYEGETDLNPHTTHTYCRTSFDGVLVPPNHIIVSNCRMLMISIRSSDYDFREDLNIPFTVIEYDKDCGRISFSGSSGNVTSPRFPLAHAHNLNCNYNIDVDRTKEVTLDFFSFNLEGTYNPSGIDECHYDWITVSCLFETDSASLIRNPTRKYCGDRSGKPLKLDFSKCVSLTVNFVTDSSVANGGFHFQYTIAALGNSTYSTPDDNIGTVSLAGPTGFIHSPRFPLHYPYNSDYVYSIKVDRTKTIGVFFYSFNLEGTSRSTHGNGLLDVCHHDWLKISCFPGGPVSHNYEHNSFDRYAHDVYRNTKYCGVKTSPLILTYTNCDSLTLNFVSDSSINSEGFEIWYAVTSPGQSDWGDTVYAGSNGTITSPNFPLSYPLNMSCTYSIDVGNNSSILLKFKYFLLKEPNSSGQCADEWLMITCNETTKVNPNNGKKFCGSIQWTSSLRFVDCSSLVLEFFSGSSTSSEGFMIEYTVVTGNSIAADANSELDCGSTLFAEASGVINLPMNPSNILASVNCTYTISTNQTSLIWLNDAFFQSNQLLQSFQDCDTERITVGCVSEGGTEVNPNTTKVGCRRGRITTTYSQTPLLFTGCYSLKLSIHSNTYDNLQTIRIPFYVVRSNEDCGNTSFSDPTGVVSSPRYPFNYPRSFNCQYTIDSGRATSFSFIIDRLNVGHGRNFDGFHYNDAICGNRWLTITCMVNGSSHSFGDRKLCGNMHFTTGKFAICHQVYINFSSDYISAERGFSIRYTMGNYDLDCGTTVFTNSSGSISLPVNPTNYPARVNCTYIISATSSLSFITLNLQKHPELFKSFHDCATEILKVGCISEGTTELNAKTTKSFCHLSSSVSDLKFDDCRTLKLSINSYTYETRQQVRVPFSVLGQDGVCGNTSFSDLTGIISTPRLPFNYLRRVRCLYTIDMDHATSFAYSIDRTIRRYRRSSYDDYDDDFYHHDNYDDVDDDDYHHHSSCGSSWLNITCLVNGSSGLVVHSYGGKKLCENTNSMRGRFAVCHQVFVSFSSDHVISETEINLRYRMGDYELNCGNLLFPNSSGIINLPRNPTSIPASVNCTYTITATSTSHMWINAYLSDLLKSFQNCDTESLTIGCISEGTTELNPNETKVLCYRDRLMGYYASHVPNRFVFVDCLTLRVSIRSITYHLPETFPISYTVFGPNEVCGNTSFSAPTGIVSTPRTRFDFPKNVNCLYVIESEHVNSVVLSIDSLNIGSPILSDGSCNNGWLTITCLINETSMDHPLADRKLCGSVSPTVARFPACRSVLLNFSTDFSSVEKGFTIRYRMGDFDPECGNTSFGGPTGFITSPLLPLSYPHNLNCLYSITGGKSNAISLSFFSFDLDGTSYEPSLDYCNYGDWLTVSCLSDESFLVNTSSSRKYCGVKTTNLTFSFPSCAVVVLNFVSDLSGSRGGFKLRYTVKDADLLCGATAFGPPNGAISFPWDYDDHAGSLDCTYFINATEPSWISLTISSINIRPNVSRNCHSDYLMISCIDGQAAGSMNFRMQLTHDNCEYPNSSIQLPVPGCKVVQIVFHRDTESTGKTFRIDYIITTSSVDTSQTEAMSVSTEIPTVTRIVTKCGDGCKINEDGTSCECSKKTAVTSSDGVGRAVGISLAVILLVIGALCLGLFLLFKRHGRRTRPETLREETEEDGATMELKTKTTKSGSSLRAHRVQDGENSGYFPLRSISLCELEESSKNSTQNDNEFQPNL